MPVPPADAYVGYMKSEIYWIASDQYAQFDAHFHIPLKDPKRFRKHVEAYLAADRSLRPEEPAALSQAMFREQLSALAAAGEDVDRLLLWFGSMLEDVPPPGPALLWTDTLQHWSRGFSVCEAAKGAEALRELVASYRKEVVDQIDRFDGMIEPSRERWMAGERSAWDDELWRIYFEEVHADPSLFFGQKYRTLQNRRWFRRQGDKLNETDRTRLFEAFVAELQRSQGDILDWNDVKPIDEAFAIDDVPDFDQVRRG